MKNKSIIIVAFILMFAFSCQKSENHEIISPLSTSKVIIDNEFIKRLSISKNFKKLYDLSVNDIESNILKKGFSIDEKYLSKLKNVKSQHEYEDILAESYSNPTKKIKQLENLYNSILDLRKEFKEL